MGKLCCIMPADVFAEHRLQQARKLLAGLDSTGGSRRGRTGRRTDECGKVVPIARGNKPAKDRSGSTCEMGEGEAAKEDRINLQLLSVRVTASKVPKSQKS